MLILGLKSEHGHMKRGPTASPSPQGGAAGSVDAKPRILSSEQPVLDRNDCSSRCVLLNIAESVEANCET